VSKPCTGRITDPVALERRNRELVEYEINYRKVERMMKKEPPDPTTTSIYTEPVDHRTGVQRLADIKHGDIMECLAEEARRGNGKGGASEKNNPKKPKMWKRTGEEWTGFDD